MGLAREIRARPNAYDSMHIIKTMEKAIFGLRIIILRKLGYDGDVQKPIDNYLFRKKIEEFLTDTN